MRALLVAGRDGAAGADHRVGRLAEDQSRPAGRHNYGVSWEGLQFQRLQIHCDETTAYLMAVHDERHHLPRLILRYLAADFVAPHLFIERVEQLLSGGSAGEGGTVMFGAPEPAEIEHALRRAREGDTHAIEEVDDRRRHFAHGLSGRLISEKVATVNSVVEVFPD